MRHIYGKIACLALAGLISGFAPADVTPGPLMIIRFNQPHVHFQQPLYRAVQKAVETNPAVVFDVVSVVRAGKDKKQEAAYRAEAEKESNRVLKALREMGVPENHVAFQAQVDDTVKTNELRIYVRQ